MKRIIILSFLITIISINIQRINADEIENSEEITFNEENIDFNKTGFIMSLSAFNYFSMGIGWNIGEWHRAGPHFGGSNYGAIIEYKTKDELHIRVYGNLYGGVSAMHLGASAIFCTNFNEVTGGLAPEIGLGFPGGNIFYRYNFYFYNWNKYNCHEIVLSFYGYNPFEKKRK